jgi:hypothetical protein
MTAPDDQEWLDGDSGRLVRPYTVSGGRTTPTQNLDLLSMMTATGTHPTGELEADHIEILNLCRQPLPVAEIAARMRLPAVVTKILLSDLLECGALTAAPARPDAALGGRVLLERVRDGLQQRL